MKKSAVVALLVLGLAFAAGVLHLFNLRFESGDVYPAYSSLRADPLGSRALHDSLAELIEVNRNFEPITRLADGRRTALLYLGVSPEEARFSTNEYRALEQFTRTGGRVVLAFHPAYVAPRLNAFAPRTTPTPFPRPGTNQPAGRRPGSRARRDPLADWGTVSIRDHWSLEFGYAPLQREGDGPYLPATAQRSAAATNDALPARLSINTAIYFDRLDPAWRVIYTRHESTNDYAVLIERRQGAGSIVLCADAFPFSNEALRSARQPLLLAWLLGNADHVSFDETHLGTATDPGLADMAKRYRLHGLAASLLLFTALFIWKSSVSFLPPREEDLSRETSHQVAGKDSAEGFIHLLQRNVAPVDLLKICLEQWNLSTAGRKPPPAKLVAMQKLIDEQNALDPRERNPVQTYRQFCEILAQRT